MRIAHLTDSYLPTVGGIELHVRDLVDRQRRVGHDARVVTPAPLPPGADEDADHVVRTGRRAAHWLTDFDPDLVHAHVSLSPYSLAGARWAALAGIPTVATVHSMLTGLGPLAGTLGDLSGVARWPVLWTAVSAAAAAPVRDIVGAPVRVVPNAVDLDAWRPRPTPSDGPPRVLAVMRLTRVKRTLPLARILGDVARHVDVHATVVGDGPQRPALTRYLRSHRLDGVHLTGTVDRSVVRRELAAASIFLAPAHRESFGIAALEARASGLPVVASARSGVASYITHGVDGLLGDSDEDLAGHLLRLLTDDGLRRALTEHNRAVPPRCSWADADEARADVYAAALAARRHPRAASPRRLVSS